MNLVVLLVLAAIGIIGGLTLYNIVCLKKEKNANEIEDERKSNHYKFKIGVCSVLIAALAAVLAIPGFVNDALSLNDRLSSTIKTTEESNTTEPQQADDFSNKTTTTATTSTTSNSTTTTTTTTTKPTDTSIKVPKNDYIKCTLTERNSNYEIDFTATASGKYGFILDIGSVNDDYKITIYDSRDEKIAVSSYSGSRYSDHTVTARLTYGYTYKIVLERIEGNPDITIKIKKP